MNYFFIDVPLRKDRDICGEDEVNCCFKLFLATPQLLLQFSSPGSELVPGPFVHGSGLQAVLCCVCEVFHTDSLVCAA